MSDRFEIIEAADERVKGARPHDDYCCGVYDNKTGEVIHWDNGEPEDQTLYRDWSWVVPLLNEVNDEAS